MGPVLMAEAVLVGKDGNIVSIFREQREMDAGALLTFSFPFSLGRR